MKKNISNSVSPVKQERNVIIHAPIYAVEVRS